MMRRYIVYLAPSVLTSHRSFHVAVLAQRGIEASRCNTLIMTIQKDRVVRYICEWVVYMRRKIYECELDLKVRYRDP